MTAPSTVAAGYAATHWRALGSYVNLVVADADRLSGAQLACERILDRIDQTCSRFRDDSDLSRANRGAGQWIKVDLLLAQAVNVAVQVAGATEGLVDPTLGSHLIALGYDRDLAEIPSREPLDGPDPRYPGSLRNRAPLPVIGALAFGTGSRPSGTPVAPDGWRQIEIDLDEGALRVPDGVTLDLGSTGKAFAADLISATVPELVGTELIISLGGDVAIGQPADRPDDAGHHWRISVAERPEDADGPDAELVILTSGGLATSSTLARRWRLAGAPVHHLLDPRTGLPVDPVWRTVSVCSETCVEANAASTAAIVLGERAPDWLREHDLAARLVDVNGRILRVAGWPEPDPDGESEPGADTPAEPESHR